MMYIIGMIILTFLALVGVAAFISAVGRAISRADGELIFVLPSLSGDDAEGRARYAAVLCEQEGGTAVICVCDQESDAAQICERLKREHPCITVTDSAHFGEG